MAYTRRKANLPKQTPRAFKALLSKKIEFVIKRHYASSQMALEHVARAWALPSHNLHPQRCYLTIASIEMATKYSERSSLKMLTMNHC